MGTNPYTAGVFYSGSYISQEFVQSFSELGIDRRVAILAEISAKPQVSQLIMHRTFANVPSLENLTTTYAWFTINTSGTLVGATLPQQFADKTDQWVNTAPPPKYLIFSDETLTARYVTSNSGGTALAASGTKPSPSLDDAQFVGEYLEMIGQNGTSIYRITVNSSNVISVTLDRDEPERAAPIRISNGHPFAYDGTYLWLEGLVSMGDVSMSIDEYEGGFSGVSTARVSNVNIQLSDNWFRFLIGQAWDTRDIEIKMGLTDEDIGLYRVVLRGKTERAEADLDQLTIVLRDHSVILDRSVQDRAFLASGVYEGIGDILGTLKPIAYGFVRHATPVLINEASSVYRVHDGPIHEIFSVHQGGILMANLGGVPTGLLHLVQWTPTQAEVDSGGYRTDYAAGAFRLAARPTAPITVSFWASTSVSRTTSRIGEIVQSLLTLRAPEITIDQNSFDAFHTEQVGAASLYLTENTSIREAIHSLVAPVGALVSVNALNVMSIRRVRARQPVAVLGKHNLVEDAMPSRRNPPRPGSSIRVGHFKNWTVLTESDFLGPPSGNIGIFLQRERSYKNMTWYGGTSTRKPVYDSAKAAEYQTLLDNTDDASRVAAFLAFRDHSLQHLYECTAIGFAFQIEIGDTVLFQLEEMGTWNIKTGIVVEVIEKSPTSSQEDLTQLLIWA